ncbi:MAG: HEPN domain-containing protein [Gammaproteobacteria bacterium]|nr:HEPN domain-containing protein [Gammaproteobacteria bacterium]
MTPEAEDYLEKARHALLEAKAVIAIDLTNAAGRAAYLVAYHAAQALIFHRTGRIAKTHGGVRAEFARVTKDDPAIDREYVTFLARAYSLKEIADYETGPGAIVPHERATAAIETAGRFIERISTLVAKPNPA